MSFSFVSWLRQPTTIAGLATFVGVAAHTAASALTHQASWSVALGGIVAAAVLVAIPDNTAAAADARREAVDVATAVLNKRLVQMAPQLFADTAALVADVSHQPEPQKVS